LRVLWPAQFLAEHVIAVIIKICKWFRYSICNRALILTPIPLIVLQSWLWHPGWPLATSNGALVLQLSDAEIAHALRPAELYLCIKLGKWVDRDRGDLVWSRLAWPFLWLWLWQGGTQAQYHYPLIKIIDHLRPSRAGWINLNGSRMEWWGYKVF